MGVVWAATQDVTRQRVALKFLKGGDQSRHQKRFFQEARAACVVKHPNIVTIHDVLHHDGSPVIVMELLEGESLRTRLAREGRLGLEDTSRVMAAVASAVGAAHARGVVHRDLKPDNIFLSTGPHTDTFSVKVLDFGIAKLFGSTSQTSDSTETGSLLGTPFYMSPEQVFGEPVSHHTDTWSLGIIAYQALCGWLPTQGKNMGQVFKTVAMGAIPSLRDKAPELPDAVLEMVMAMLGRHADDRPPLREVKRLFEQYAGEHTPDFGPPSDFDELLDVTDAEAHPRPGGDTRGSRYADHRRRHRRSVIL